LAARPALRRHGAGVFLTGDPQRVRILIRTLRAATHLPVSAKIRLGECLDESRLLDFCRMLEGEGVDLLTVHGRLDKEKFCRRPRWDWIGTVKRAVAIPVLANGGIFSVEEARQCLRASGADGLMLVLATAAQAAGSSMPWEGPLQSILDSIQGPVARIVAVIIIIATGLALAFGDTSGGFRKLIQIVFGLSIAFAASSFFLSFFSFSGGAVV